MSVEKRYVTDLELDLTEHCNLGCVQCTHNSPFFTPSDEQYSYESFERDLNIISKFIHVEAFRMVGGEPLMNKRVLEYAKLIKSLKVSNHITMFTNGILLHKAPDELFKTIDRLRISVYNLSDVQLELIRNNIKSIRQKFPELDVVACRIRMFLKTNLIETHKDPETLKQVYENCFATTAEHGLAMFNGRLYKCYATRKKYNFLKAHEHLVKEPFEHMKNPELDSIEINESLTQKRLDEYLDKREILEGCKWCLGCSGKAQIHHQIGTIDGEKDYATLEDVDIEAGKSYLSNCIFSWAVGMRDFEFLRDGEHFKAKYLKDYNTKFLFETKQFD